MRRIAIACIVLAGVAPASAQPAATPAPSNSAAPDPATAPATPAPATQTPDTQGTAPAAAPVPAPPPPPDVIAPPPRDRALAEEQCSHQEPSCDWLATLSTLEQASVRRAFAARGYEIDAAPWGKVIERVEVYNEDVFAEPNPFLQFFNHFHVTTTERTIRTDSVVQAGEVWDQARVEETARHLRDPLYSSVVAVVPVVARDPAKVNVLIVTRDIWSLRFNTSYTFQQGKLTNLSTSLSENNFLGRRELLSLGLVMDQGAIAVGPLFIDKNLFGEHINFQAQVQDIINRDDLLQHSTLHNEGTQSTITLTRPLWSLASEWAGGVVFTHRFAINRQFRGTALDTIAFQDPATGVVSPPFGREYKMHQWNVNAFVTRQWGSEVKQQLSFGHTVDNQRPRPLDDFAGTAAERQAFIDDVLPRSEVTSVPYVEYAMFTPRYHTLRNISSFDLAEDLRVGPSLDLVLGQGLKLLGSDNNFQRWSSSLGWVFPWTRDGFVSVSGSFNGRYQSGDIIDATASGTLRFATPPIQGVVRLLAQSQISTRFHDTQNNFYALGSDTGLRGFAINQFTGQRFFDTQIEARTLPYPVWVFRIGGVAFYDLGDAADTFKQFQLHQDAGIGLRALIPQLSSQLYKFDFAIPFDGPNRGTLRFLAGFGSEF
ncbi:MAG TPA: BamA/TamA family outer membrane protein [Kofleriaceae bacterium]|nr:BamA/TamA family outer membrane protein [Kofleriaceae bacterium]